jgi:hypothetical protein
MKWIVRTASGYVHLVRSLCAGDLEAELSRDGWHSPEGGDRLLRLVVGSGCAIGGAEGFDDGPLDVDRDLRSVVRLRSG